ncbi:MAG: hypothetical protein JNJ60_16275 [Rhodocyclaceae bacterium]|nr:hypothetical protein [Rhodocyclaceae bacterium]
MLDTKHYRLLLGLAALQLLLIALYIGVHQSNLSRMAAIAERQTFIQQSVQLEGLYREIVRSLAELSARNKDEALRAMLAAQGITVTVNPPAPAAAAGKEQK